MKRCNCRRISTFSLCREKRLDHPLLFITSCTHNLHSQRNNNKDSALCSFVWLWQLCCFSSRSFTSPRLPATVMQVWNTLQLIVEAVNFSNSPCSVWFGGWWKCSQGKPLVWHRTRWTGRHDADKGELQLATRHRQKCSQVCNIVLSISCPWIQIEPDRLLIHANF